MQQPSNGFQISEKELTQGIEGTSHNMYVHSQNLKKIIKVKIILKIHNVS